MNSALDDKALFERWANGDAGGFAALYERYKNRVFGFLLRMTGNRETAEDLMQETFLAAHRNLEQFDRNRVFLSWIFGIAHKRTIDHFRHVKVENEHRDRTDRSVGSRIEGPEDAVDKKKLRKLVGEAVDMLEPNQREVFLLRELGGVPFKEIADIMDCPINTALGRMRLALINIRKELKKRGIERVH
jgi:RNA polymerase sigma-70 factor (ECF subfamily)